MSGILEYSSDIADQEAPAPLPVGDYPATIREAKLATSKTTGNEYVAVQFAISADDYPADYTEGNPDGTIITYNLTGVAGDTPSGRYKMKRFCEAIGAPLGKTIDLNSWVGLSGVVTIEHEEWEGVPRARITRVVSA